MRLKVYEENDETVPWVEKYRPTSLDEVVSQNYTIQCLNTFIEQQSIPHLIFTGPAGTGKTSTSIALISDLLGTKHISKDAVLERNASDQCRMKDFPEIKNFVFSRSLTHQSYKFVVLDEADNLSRDVQSALRRVIEMAPPNVKFILMCNFIEKILDPVLSRCAIFRFYPLPKKDFLIQIEKIAKNENVKLSDDIKEAIYYITRGDMRGAINLLQISVAVIKDEKGVLHYDHINSDIIYKMSGFIPNQQFLELFNCLYDKNIDETLLKLREHTGFSSRAFCKQLMDKIIEKRELIQHPILEKIINLIAEYDYRLSLQVNPEIQMDGLLADVRKQILSITD